jgi:polyisoprenoid-binding protein YceI
MATPYGAEGATGGCEAAMLNHPNPGFLSVQLAIRLWIMSVFFNIRILMKTSPAMEFDDRLLRRSNRLIHKVTHGQSGFVRMRTCLCLSLPMLSIAVNAQQSRATDMTFDPASTSIRWTLGAVLHTVHGSFRLKSGVVHLDPKTGEMTGLLIVDATSGESGNSARDQKMHQGVLESSQYGTITFRPIHLNGTFQSTQAQTLMVDGVLNLHGKDHPLQLTVNLRPNSNEMSVATHFEVPYVQWGLKDPSTFVLRVSKDVSVDIEATAQMKP